MRLGDGMRSKGRRQKLWGSLFTLERDDMENVI